MRFLLDTDHISLIEKKQQPEYGTILANSLRYPPSDILMCVVSFHVQVLGCQTYIARAKGTADLVRGYDTLLGVIKNFTLGPVLPFDSLAAAEFDRLTAAKIRVPTMDLRIAAIALANGLILITRNARDFSKVPGLLIDDWTR